MILGKVCNTKQLSNAYDVYVNVKTKEGKIIECEVSNISRVEDEIGGYIDINCTELL